MNVSKAESNALWQLFKNWCAANGVDLNEQDPEDTGGLPLWKCFNAGIEAAFTVEGLGLHRKQAAQLFDEDD